MDMAKWVNLYHAVNQMMMRMGADRKVNTQQVEAENVLAALEAIDGGVYNDKMDPSGQSAPGGVRDVW